MWLRLGFFVRFSKYFWEGENRTVVFSYSLWGSLLVPIVMMSAVRCNGSETYDAGDDISEFVGFAGK